MRILHVVGGSSYGGGSIVVLRLCAMAMANGWQVDVLTTDQRFAEELGKIGAGVIKLDCIWRDIRPLRDIRGLLLLRRFLSKANYDLVHTHTSKAGFVGRLAATYCMRRPIIIHTVHGFAFHEESSWPAKMAYSSLERVAAACCDRIVTVSRYHREWALRLGIGKPGQISAIPNGIPHERVLTTQDPSLVRSGLGCTSEDFVFLTIGRLGVQKGLEYLIRAIPHVLPWLPYCKVIIAGEGPLRDSLVTLAKHLGVAERVSFVGFQADVGALLSAADVVVLPSLWEGLSISLLEAMAAEKPILTTSIGSNDEVLVDGVSGLIVARKDPVALAQGMRRLAEDQVLRKGLGQAALLRYEQFYTEDRMLGAYQKIYSDLLGQTVPEGVLLRIATSGDLPGIASVHQAAFKGFFLSQMGRSFLERYYRILLDYEKGHLLVAVRERRVIGFVSGFGDPRRFYQYFARQKRKLLWPIIKGLACRPWLLGRICSNVTRVCREGTTERPDECELSSIAVDPGSAGAGIGKLLIRRFSERCFCAGASLISLTTDAKDNEAVIGFYQRCGFIHAGTFESRPGRAMHRFTLESSACGT